MAKTNIEYLSVSLNDEQQEWLDAIISEHHQNAHDLECKLEQLNSEIEDLENELKKAKKTELGTPIDTGIGIIRYKTDGSLVLDQLMEAVTQVIQKDGAIALLRSLENMYTV